MKLKILVVPVLIAVTIGFIIWMVVPIAQSITAKKQEVKSGADKLADIQQKNLNAGKLDSDFTANAAKWSVLMKFIPAKENDEDIINNLNYLATSAGVSLSSLDVSQGAAGIADKNSKNNLGLQNFKVSMIIAGSYEKIKLFMEKVNKLERYSNCSSLKISDTKAESNQAEGGKNLSVNEILQMEAVLNFSYMREDKTQDVSANEGIFANAVFDLAVIDSIQEKMKTGLINLQVGATGKSNPFAPVN